MLVKVRGSLDRDAQLLAHDLPGLDGFGLCTGNGSAGTMGSQQLGKPFAPAAALLGELPLACPLLARDHGQ
jgi:hypothetical protein